MVWWEGTQVSLKKSTIEKGKNLAELSDDIGYLASRASGILIQATNGALADLGLRVRSYSTLILACDTPGGMTQRDLAEVLGLDPSQVVQLVDELERAGLVERRPSAADRRTRLIAATRAGRQVRRTAEKRVAGVHRAALGALSEGERSTLRELLGRFIAAAGADQASA